MLNITKIENLLGQVYDIMQSNSNELEHTAARKQFVFHMTDWLDDLEILSKVYIENELATDDVAKTVAGFLYHVIPHLNAAGRLLLDHIPDAFTEDNESP